MKGGYPVKTYISIDKRSKKAKKEYYSSQRNSWGNLNPVTRTMPNGKAYNRKKKNAEFRKAMAAGEPDRRPHLSPVFYSAK